MLHILTQGFGSESTGWQRKIRNFTNILKNCTAQLKINRFYRNKNKLAEGHIENQLFQ
jgi:hypothetical protein